jgi:hypothetical protein
MRRRAGDKLGYDEEATWMQRRSEEEDLDEDSEATETRRAYCMVLGFILILVVLIWAAVGSTLLSKQAGESKGQFQRWFDEGEDAVFNNTRAEVRRFRAEKTMPTFGLTQGKYHFMDGVMCQNCAVRLRTLCGYETLNATRPPLELIIPGRLSARPTLSERSQCFMWYANSFWTRPTGGKAGFLISRLGAGIDNKTWFLEALHSYESKHGCIAYSVYPPTVELSDAKDCTDFFNNNGKWAATSDALWFIKASDGSTGRHISLMRRRDIERSGVRESMSKECPLKGGIASLEVPNLYTIDNKKFDNRVFVLVPTIKPLVVLFRQGHLRLSVMNYSDGSDEEAPPLQLNASLYSSVKSWAAGNRTQDFRGKGRGHRGPVISSGSGAASARGRPEDNEDLARHVTNPRFGFAHTNDTSLVMQEVEFLRDALVREHGAHKGQLLYAHALRSVRRAVLMALHAVKSKLAHKDYHTRWGFVMMAMDVAYDIDMNAYVLDVNSGPSFYHDHPFPPWFRQERSSLIREALDIVQEMAFYKVAQNNATNRIPTAADLWEPLFHQLAGGPQSRDLPDDGDCVVARRHGEVTIPAREGEAKIPAGPPAQAPVRP